ncbi:MAG: hypothetical protein EPN61_04445 [Burkholderiaceae bacterium]|nr:MAG: hypothetical protein EPN61_04445 [Burkholderiaceae bacterium]
MDALRSITLGAGWRATIVSVSSNVARSCPARAEMGGVDAAKAMTTADTRHRLMAVDPGSREAGPSLAVKGATPLLRVSAFGVVPIFRQIIRHLSPAAGCRLSAVEKVY